MTEKIETGKETETGGTETDTEITGTGTEIEIVIVTEGTGTETEKRKNPILKSQLKRLVSLRLCIDDRETSLKGFAEIYRNCNKQLKGQGLLSMKFSLA